jgi:cytochrome P450
MSSATYDLTSDAYFADPYLTYALMRKNDPVYQLPGTSLWYVTRYEDLAALFRDPRFSSARVDEFFVGISDDLAEQAEAVHRFFSDWLNFTDPPQHTRLRKLMVRAFSPRNIAALEPFVRAVANEAISQIPETGSFDVIADLGFPVPSRVISHMLGVPPDDIASFEGWSHDAVRVMAWTDDQNENVKIAYQGVRNLEGYFRGLIADRRTRPADDLLSLLVQADEDGQILTEQELVSTCALLLMAGHETTTNLIGNAVIALLRHPAELARLRANPALIDTAVEEFLRYDGSSGVIGRVALQEAELGGTIIPAGHVAMGMTQSANRDEAVFSDPDRFDITRPPSQHLGLGHGPHLCLGRALARLETKIAIGSLVAAFPQLELQTEQLPWLRSLAARGVSSLPVTAS